MIIAVDGPAASGKGTIARAIATHFGLPHLDTGALYRAVGLAVLQAGGDVENADEAAHHAGAFDVALLDDPALRSAQTARAASIVSAHRAVRDALVKRQRDFARQPGGAVLDGRDIGTVIVPDADVKLYVTANVEERARRRQAETPGSAFADVLANLKERDARDSERAIAPMKPAEDAVMLDTSSLDREAAITAAIGIVARAKEKSS